MWGVLVNAGIAVITWALPKLLSLFGIIAVSAGVYTPVFTYIHNQISQQLTGLPAEALDFLYFTGVPNAISIIFAAVTLRITTAAAERALARKGAN